MSPVKDWEGQNGGEYCCPDLGVVEVGHHDYDGDDHGAQEKDYEDFGNHENYSDDSDDFGDYGANDYGDDDHDDFGNYDEDDIDYGEDEDELPDLPLE